MKNTEETIHSLVKSAIDEIISLIAKDIRELKFIDIVRTTHKTVNNLGVKIIEQIVKILDERYDNQ